MSSGLRTMKFNTRERALSTDVNRLQSFLASDLAETLRALFMRPVDNDSFNGVQLTSTPNGFFSSDESVDRTDIVGTPLQGIILSGLGMIMPVGATSIIIQPGVVVFADPDGQSGSSDPDPPNADENPAKIVRDPGVPTLGVLTWTPNAGPGRRMDFVEVRRQEIVQEADNRDIYDPVTATFTAQSVDKVIVSQLEYRIRLGTQGAGLPAVAQGWMPLAVLSTPSSAVNLDTVDAWDVRPLASDLDNHCVRNPGIRTRFTKRDIMLDVVSTPGSALLQGSIEGVARGGWKIGGTIRAPSGAAQVNLFTTEYQPGGFSVAPGNMWRIYSVFPLGLPRWVRYSDASLPATAGGVAGRAPGSWRGVLACSISQDFRGCGSSSITMPTGLGFTGTVPGNRAILVGVATTANSGEFQGFIETTKQGVMFPWHGQGNVPWRTIPQTNLLVGVWVFGNLDTQLYAATAPPSARSVRVKMQCVTTDNGMAIGESTSTMVQMHLVDSGSGNRCVTSAPNACAMHRRSVANIIFHHEFEIPTAVDEFGLQCWDEIHFELFEAQCLPANGGTMIVTGWSFI